MSVLKRSALLRAALCAVLLMSGTAVRAVDEDAAGFERTPPRLSFMDGDVSFWRPGAQDWAPARVNTPLAAGDQLYSAEGANLEVQIGSRAFVRAAESTQLGFTSLEPDFLQIRVTDGHVSLDLRSVTAGQTIEVDTPNAAFQIERSGYYLVEVEADTTTFTTRRGGRASLTPSSGEPVLIASSEQVVVRGGETPQVETYAAPELDAWDRWNYQRTDEQLDAVSARYVPSGVYGVDDLDQYGDWRVVPTYGAMWVPRGVPAGWAPYSTGTWMYDPFYAWTWVDTAPWGWAPYHYGRWVNVSGFWGWCPGPLVSHAYYAPALVAFYGGGGLSIGVTFGTPRVGWVALGWGEPLVPWWGPPHFREHAHWAGWGGPRYVNNVIVQHNTVVNVHEINVYQNAHVHDAIVAVDRKHFGRGDHEEAHFTRGKPDGWKPLRGDLDAKPDRSSLVAAHGPARRPPNDVWQRRVIATREPRLDRAPELEAPRAKGKKPEVAVAPEVTPPARVVGSPGEGASRHIEASKRPPFGRDGAAERQMPPPPPRFRREASRAEMPAGGMPQAPEPGRGSAHEAPAPPRTAPEHEQAAPRAGAPAPPPVPHEPQMQPPGRGEGRGRRGAEPQMGAPGGARELPGEPANRVYRERHGAMSRGAEPPAQRMPDAAPQRGAQPMQQHGSRGGPPQSQHQPQQQRHSQPQGPQRDR
jgi:hypothetical protein